MDFLAPRGTFWADLPRSGVRPSARARPPPAPASNFCARAPAAAALAAAPADAVDIIMHPASNVPSALGERQERRACLHVRVS